MAGAMIPRGPTYKLPVGSDLVLGGVKSGGDVTINPDGTMDIDHSNFPKEDRHGIHSFEYADQVSRESAVLASTDIGKVAWQIDNDSFWVLKDNDPLAWAPFTNLGGGVNHIAFDVTPTPPAYAAGQLFWDTNYKTLVLQTGTTSLQIGQEFYAYVRNNSGATIPNGKVVYISGSFGDLPTIAKAKADSPLTSDAVLGLTTEDIANGANGFITVLGGVHDIDTSAFVAGASLFLSDVTAGEFTDTQPESPSYVVHLGHVMVSHATEGSVYMSVNAITQMADSVRFESGPGVTELNNVQDFFRHVWSTGVTDGCDITDNGDGTVSLSAGECLFRIANSDDADLIGMVVPAQLNIPCIANDVTYLYVNYNGGNPVWQTGLSLGDFNGFTTVVAYLIGRNGTTLNIVDLRKANVDAGRKNRRQKAEFDGYVFNGWWRSSQAKSILTASGLNPLVGAGRYFINDVPIEHSTFDMTIAGTAAANVFTYFYNRTGTWTQITNQKTVNNTQYDNAGVLTNLGSNKYRTDYVYVVMGASAPRLVLVMGNAEYGTLAAAQAAPIPSILPPQIDGIAILIGQIVILKSDLTVTIQLVGNLFSVTAGGGGGITIHNDLTGLQGGTAGEYYHLTSTHHVDLTDGGDSTLHYHSGDRARANHTGTQATSTVDGLDAALADRFSKSVDDTDDIVEGVSNLFHTAARVRAVVLTGLSFASNAVISATDTIIEAFGKLQAQIELFGTLAFQDADAVNITGGTIDGTVIGGVTPAAGTFTELRATGNSILGDSVSDSTKLFGTMSIGNGTPVTSIGMYQTNINITGATTARGQYMNWTFGSDVTSAAYGLQTQFATTVASYTTTTVAGFRTEDVVKGSGHTITNQYGYICSALTAGVNNYGFHSNIAAATNRWNFYAAGTAPNFFNGDLQLGKTVTAGGTTGAQTINKTIGTVNFAAAATSLVVTNSLVTTSSIILATVGTNDSTMKSVACVAASGSFTIYPNAAPTAETRVNFMVVN